MANKKQKLGFRLAQKADVHSYTNIGILQKYHTQDIIWYFVNNDGQNSSKPSEKLENGFSFLFVE